MTRDLGVRRLMEAALWKYLQIPCWVVGGHLLDEREGLCMCGHRRVEASRCE